ncbi:MAG: tetratricopeptide repeat protein [Verrucomicrobiia bacterium]
MAQQTRTDWSFSEQFEPDLFWQRHGKKIVYAIVALLAIGVVAYVWQRQQAEEADRMAQRLDTATDPQALQGIIHDYPDKPAVKEAILKLAGMHFQAGHFADAANLYQKFLNNYPHDPLAESASFGLASIEESQDHFTVAKTEYLELVAAYPNGFIAKPAKLGAARCAEVLGQLKEARQLYEEVLATSREGSPLFETAAIRSFVLRRNLPAEVAETPTDSPPAQLTLPSIPAGPSSK